MNRLIRLAVGLFVFVLGSACATVSVPKLTVPKPVTADEFSKQPPDTTRGFLFIRFLNQGPDSVTGTSLAVLVHVATGKARILAVVGPLNAEADYSTLFQTLHDKWSVYAPAGFFCDGKEPCKSQPYRPMQSPGPPPPEAGSITSVVTFSGSLDADANAAAAAALNTVQAAQH
jgi:hypothetical protein